MGYPLVLTTMARAEQVRDGFDRVEYCGWDLDEKGVPMGHPPVPKARMLQGPNRAAFKMFFRDDPLARILSLIHI